MVYMEIFEELEGVKKHLLLFSAHDEIHLTLWFGWGEFYDLNLPYAVYCALNIHAVTSNLSQ